MVCKIINKSYRHSKNIIYDKPFFKKFKNYLITNECYTLEEFFTVYEQSVNETIPTYADSEFMYL